jgi:hypothetical protein
VTAPVYFKYDRKLLGELCHCARESLEIFSRMALSLDEHGYFCYPAFKVRIRLQE